MDIVVAPYPGHGIHKEEVWASPARAAPRPDGGHVVRAAVRLHVA